MSKKLTEIEKNLIKVVRDCPPINQINEGLIDQLTPCQLEYYKTEHQYWCLVSLGLEAYFSGESIEIILENELNNPPSKQLILEIDKWLAFYDLINFGWKDIVNFLKKENITLRLKKPGEAFQFVIWCESIFHFSNCLLPHYVYSPQKSYRTYKKFQNIYRKQAAKSLTCSEQNFLNGIDRELQLHPYKDFLYGAFYQGVFIGITSKSKNKNVRNKSKSYLRADGELDDEKLRPIHPSKLNQGYAIADGRKLIGKKGGWA